MNRTHPLQENRPDIVSKNLLDPLRLPTTAAVATVKLPSILTPTLESWSHLSAYLLPCFTTHRYEFNQMVARMAWIRPMVWGEPQSSNPYFSWLVIRGNIILRFASTPHWGWIESRSAWRITRRWQRWCQSRGMWFDHAKLLRNVFLRFEAGKIDTTFSMSSNTSRSSEYCLKSDQAICLRTIFDSLPCSKLFVNGFNDFDELIVNCIATIQSDLVVIFLETMSPICSFRS